MEKIRAMAAIVVELQARYDSENHHTTGCDFMYGDLNKMKHPFDHVEWMERRNAIMGPIEEQRTEAIWSLSRLLDDADHRVGRELLDAHMGRNSLINALALAVEAAETVH